MGEEHLRDRLRALGEGLLVGLHEQPLAGGGERLLDAQFFVGGLDHAQATAARGHRPGSDQDHLAAGGLEKAHLAGDIVDDLRQQAVVAGEHGAAHLDNHPSGLVEQGLAVKQAVFPSHLEGHHASPPARFP